MPKGKRKVYVEPPVEKEPEDEADAPSPEVEVPEVEASPPAEEKKVETCTNCGLPIADFARIFTGLRIDLQVQNARKLCPRCFKPVEPY